MDSSNPNQPNNPTPPNLPEPTALPPVPPLSETANSGQPSLVSPLSSAPTNQPLASSHNPSSTLYPPPANLPADTAPAEPLTPTPNPTVPSFNPPTPLPDWTNPMQSSPANLDPEPTVPLNALPNMPSPISPQVSPTTIPESPAPTAPQWAQSTTYDPPATSNQPPEMNGAAPSTPASTDNPILTPDTANLPPSNLDSAISSWQSTPQTPTTSSTEPNLATPTAKAEDLSSYDPFSSIHSSPSASSPGTPPAPPSTNLVADQPIPEPPTNPLATPPTESTATPPAGNPAGPMPTWPPNSSQPNNIPPFDPSILFGNSQSPTAPSEPAPTDLSQLSNTPTSSAPAPEPENHSPVTSETIIVPQTEAAQPTPSNEKFPLKLVIGGVAILLLVTLASVYFFFFAGKGGVPATGSLPAQESNQIPLTTPPSTTPLQQATSPSGAPTATSSGATSGFGAITPSSSPTSAAQLLKQRQQQQP